MRACIYNRCSTEEETQKNALEIQVCESREIVMAKGWTVERQYVELQSGTTTCRRSEYQKMLNDLECDFFDVVVVKSIDRLTRSAKDWYLFLERLIQNRKKLYLYIDQKFYTPDDNLLIGIKAILAEDFSRELSKKIKNAHRRRQEKKSGFNITVPIFGWDKVEKDKYVLNEEEANIYRLAFAMAEEGNGFYTIAKRMYERGVRSKKGGRISEVQWKKMLQSPRAHGDVVLHTTEYDFEMKKTRKIPERDWIVIEGALPPIVTKEYQERVIENLKTRTKSNHFVDYTRNMTTKGKYPLSGKIRCAECGAIYYRSKVNQRKQVVWKCSTYLKQGRVKGCSNIAVLEEDVFGALEAHFELVEDIMKEAEKMLERVLGEEHCEKTIKQMEKRIEQLEQRKRCLVEKLLDGLIDDEECRQFLDEIKDKIEELKMRKVQMRQDNGERLEIAKEELRKDVFRQAFLRVMLLDVKMIEVYREGELQVHFQ